MVTDTDISQLRNLILMLRAEGVTHFSVGDLRLELGSAPLRPETKDAEGARPLPAALRDVNPMYLDPALGLAWQER